MDYLSICAIVKDENSYLPEWIEYHKLVGVERFYIYDNDSREPIARTLAKDISKGLVTVIPFQGWKRQCMAYESCVTCFGQRTFWMAFIDIDEFICPHENDDLRTLLRDYESFGGLGIHWQMFGPSGHLVRPEGLQIERFTWKAPVHYPYYSEHIKTIARPSEIRRFTNPHSCEYKEGFSVNELKNRFDGPLTGPASVSKVQINHYVTRSRSEFEEKCIRGGGDATSRYLPFYDEAERRFCQLKDESILRFADPLKRAMTSRSNSNL